MYHQDRTTCLENIELATNSLKSQYQDQIDSIEEMIKLSKLEVQDIQKETDFKQKEINETKEILDLLAKKKEKLLNDESEEKVKLQNLEKRRDSSIQQWKIAQEDYTHHTTVVQQLEDEVLSLSKNLIIIEEKMKIRSKEQQDFKDTSRALQYQARKADEINQQKAKELENRKAVLALEKNENDKLKVKLGEMQEELQVCRKKYKDLKQSLKNSNGPSYDMLHMEVITLQGIAAKKH